MQSRLYVNEVYCNKEHIVNEDKENICMEKDTNTHMHEIYANDTTACSKKEMHDIESEDISKYLYDILQIFSNDCMYYMLQLFAEDQKCSQDYM